MAEPLTPEALPPPEPVYAFRCKNCLTLVPAEYAGEQDVPHQCPVCRAGQRWHLDESGQPIHTLQPENWLVLADATPDELDEIQAYHMAKDAETGLPVGEPIAIERHVPFRTTVSRGPDTTEQVTHKTPLAHYLPANAGGHAADDDTRCPECVIVCPVCQVDRPGTTEHVGGKVDTVTNPTYIHETVPLNGAPPTLNPTPQHLERTASESLATEDNA